MARRPPCANCGKPVPTTSYRKDRVVTSFCTLACGAEFGERAESTTGHRIAGEPYEG